MNRKSPIILVLLAVLLVGSTLPVGIARAIPQTRIEAQASTVTPNDLILAMNTLRVSNGLPALIEDPIINAVAQGTAETMAANQMSWHIGNVRGRIQAAGYGGGATVFATENFAVGRTMGIDQIMLAWADPDHMRPAVNPAYCHVGAGVAKAANGSTYYVLQAAYTASSSCGPYETPPGGDIGSNGGPPPVFQLIVPVEVATPDADGKIFHVVKPGQSFWAIAIAYQITIADLEFWNNLSRDQKLQVGQRLFIPDENTAGFATPTPVGMVNPSPPDKDGKIVHTVEPYHTLIKIAEAYQVSVDTILALNGLQIDWPLQVGQKLLISPGNITPSPPLSPLQRLTPDPDGNFYHTVQTGETLSGIAGLYEISASALMAWNGLNENSIIRPDQKLLLPVTPPPTDTPTPGPPTASPSPTLPPPSATPSVTPRVASTPTLTPTSGSLPAPSGQTVILGLTLAALGILLLGAVVYRRRPAKKD